MITVSASAIAYIKKMVEKEKGIGLRLTIKRTGCSGFSYAPTIVQAANTRDKVLTDIHDVQIYVDLTWLHLLDDLHIDYIDEDKTGLKQKRLIFTNPKEAARCGCGESFHVEETR